MDARKATFRSNRSKAPMQQFACVSAATAARPSICRCTASPPSTSATSRATPYPIRQPDGRAAVHHHVSLAVRQIWNDPRSSRTSPRKLCEHIASVYRRTRPERIYFLMLYNIFSEFLEDITEDVLPNDLTGYQDSLIWKKLYNFQRDAATGIINKLETYNGCILADSVGLARHSPPWPSSSITNCATGPSSCSARRSWRTTGSTTTATSTPTSSPATASTTTCSATPTCSANQRRFVRHAAQPHQLGQLRPGRHRRVAQLPKQRRYQGPRDPLPAAHERVIRQGVKTKVLMLSATPVNNRFTDLRNQLALAYEGESRNSESKLRTDKNIEEIFRRAQAVFNAWSKLPPEERTAAAILDALDFDFFELLDSVTIARSRKHIETFYDTADIGSFPERLQTNLVSLPADPSHRRDRLQRDLRAANCHAHSSPSMRR